MTDQIPVTISTENQVMTIAWNRPEKKNALTQLMYATAADAIKAAAEDDAVRAVLITGTQECFTAGNDLGDFLNNPASGEEAPVSQFLLAISTLEKPIVAAVNGPAVGIGTTMLLHCDMVVAADTTVFCMPFSNLGLCPEAASSFLLPRLAGHQRAAELLLLGENFDAQQAKECGIINYIAAADSYLALANDLVNKLASKPPTSIRMTKQFLKQGQDALVQERMRTEGEAFAQLLRGPEAREAMTAFMERREPDFSKF
ncbi:enoyl-CoA hydratase [Oceanicoccus sagamiensis]|uniref:Enoyl-CoA hydratase n=1 Tax=Oceanicoccus sagamiensis TaxID=716816 RepID=A0A1X9NMT2_9GAMM|nr:enoyl-CoA hydratase [Oceanicoccus sagamiensis]ARN75213.1 enoyl-CoA hydratase [Oceanicoccus sagamiensis]